MQRSTLATCLAALGAFVLTAPAQALNNRSYVSAFGSDNANCQQPPTACRTLQAAHDKTNPGGEIDILDPGGYGSLTITKAISIVNDGVGVAGLVPPVGGAGITINASASDAISLRGLTIDGLGRSGTNGIVFNSGGPLTIRDCVIRRNTGSGTTGHGLRFKPTGAGKLAISDSVFESNTSSGIHIDPTGSGDVKAVLDHIEANSNSDGVLVGSSGKTSGSVKVSVSDSVAAFNSTAGFDVFSNTTIPATITLMRSVAANNGIGLHVNGGSGSQLRIRVGESMVTDNGFGFLVPFLGQVLSYGTNQIDGNGSGDDFTSNIPLD